MYQINITTDDAKNIVEFIELWFIPSIRQDEEIDNINYLKSILMNWKRIRMIYLLNMILGINQLGGILIQILQHLNIVQRQNFKKIINI